MVNYECLQDKENQSPEGSAQNTKIGWAGKPMRIRPPDDYEPWRKMYLRGLQMRRNIISSNYEGWRIYANRYVSNAKKKILQEELELNLLFSHTFV